MNRISFSRLCFVRARTPGKLSIYVKRWTADIAIPCSRPAGDKNLFNRKLGYSTAQSLSLSPTHLPDMTEILLKRT